METITTTPEKFNKVKSRLDGYMFWRETEKGIEIKFIKAIFNHIDKWVIDSLIS